MDLDTDAVPREVLAVARAARTIAVFTGAGMSAASGLPTFRDIDDGVWARYDPMTFATPEAFAAEPDLVWAWYAWRRQEILRHRPNPGHDALAEWARSATVSVITQNVDDFHERAGSDPVIHLHGSLTALRCFDCALPYHAECVWPEEQVERLAPPHCPRCSGLIRPGIVWFGESLPLTAFGRAEQLCLNADLLLVVGTSGVVHPAADIPLLASRKSVPTVEINPEHTELSDQMTHTWRAPAAEAIPALVAALAQ